MRGLAAIASVCMCVNPAWAVISGETPDDAERRFDAICGIGYTSQIAHGLGGGWSVIGGSGTLIAPDLILVARHSIEWHPDFEWFDPGFTPPPQGYMTARFRRQTDGTIGHQDPLDPDGDEGASSFFQVSIDQWYLAPWPGGIYANPTDLAIGRLTVCVTHIDPIPVRFEEAVDLALTTPLRVTGWGMEGCPPLGGCPDPCVSSHRLKHALNEVDDPPPFPTGYLNWHPFCTVAFPNRLATGDSGSGVLLESSLCGSLEVIAVNKSIGTGTMLGAFEESPTFPIFTYINPCLADLNNDLFVNGFDLAELLANWEGTIHGDLNCDGIVDGLDLAFLLGAWGSCPSICPIEGSAAQGDGEEAESEASTSDDPFLIWAQQATIEELLHWLETGQWPGACSSE